MLTPGSEVMARSQTLKLKAHLSQKPEQLRRVEAQMQNLLDKWFAVEVPSEMYLSGTYLPCLSVR